MSRESGLTSEEISKPKEKPKGENREKNEEIETLFEQLILNAEKINDGNNGVIARVDVSQLSPEARKLLSLDEGVQGQQAMKLLKVFRPGMGRNEAHLQLEAYRAVNQREGLAKVPKVYAQADVPIRSVDAQSKLRAMGVSSSDEVHVLIMELVGGFDLATILYREVVKRHSKLTHLRPHVDELALDALIREVGDALNFEIPGGKQRNDLQRKFEAEKVFQSNAEKLMAFLKRDGFTLDPDVIDKLDKTIDVLHEHGILHRDLHERNIMIDESGQIYLIDFGSATQIDGPVVNEDLSSNIVDTTKPMQDKAIVNRYRSLVTSAAEDQKQITEEALKKFERIKKRIESHPAWKNFLAAITKKDVSLDVSSLDRLVGSLQITLAKNQHSDFAREIEVVSLFEVFQNAPEIARQYVGNVLQDKTVIEIRKNALRKFLADL